MKDASIGARIAEAREAAGYSAAQAARRLGVDSRTLQRWERDESVPRGNRLMMLAGLLGVSPAWLLVGEQQLPSRSDSDWTQVKSQLANARQMLDSLASIVDSLERRVDRALAQEVAEE